MDASSNTHGYMVLVLGFPGPVLEQTRLTNSVPSKVALLSITNMEEGIYMDIIDYS